MYDGNITRKTYITRKLVGQQLSLKVFNSCAHVLVEHCESSFQLMNTLDSKAKCTHLSAALKKDDHSLLISYNP